jgi:hypothetical protein
VLNRHHREKIKLWGKRFKARMKNLFTVLLTMCAYCGTTTWDAAHHNWQLVTPSGKRGWVCGGGVGGTVGCWPMVAFHADVVMLSKCM